MNLDALVLMTCAITLASNWLTLRAMKDRREP